MKGKRLSVKVKKDIRLRKKNGEKRVDIALHYGISLSTVNHVIRYPQAKLKKRGRPTKLSDVDCHNLVYTAQTNPTKSAKSLASHVGLAVSPQTIHREL